MSDWLERGEMVMSSMSSNFSELLVTDPYEYITESTANRRSDNIFRKSPDMFLDYLEDWDYIKGLIDVFASPLHDIITRSPITISFNKEELKQYEDFINNKLAECNLKDKIVDSISEIIYRGSFFKILAYDKTSQTFRIADVKRSYRTVVVDKFDKTIGYLVNRKFIPYNEGIYASYQSQVKRRFTLSDINDSEIREKIISSFGGSFPKKLEKEIVIYTHSGARSAFWGQAQKLFQIYLNDFILQFLALKDSIRQELITVTVNSLPKKVINTSEVTQSIEETLNQGSNLLVQQDPQSMLSQVIFTLFNSARVLPAIENYSSVNKLDLLEFREKRAQLMEENEALKRQINSNLGVPDEWQAGTGNRWEILSRSDRVLTALNRYVEVGNEIVKNTVVSMMASIGRFCTVEDINFNYLNDTPLQSQMSRNKAALFTDSLRDHLSSINGIKALASTGMFNIEGLYSDFLEQIKKWGFPFTSSFKSIEEIMNDMQDKDSAVNNFTGIEF